MAGENTLKTWWMLSKRPNNLIGYQILIMYINRFTHLDIISGLEKHF